MPESIRPLFLAAGWYPGRRAWFTRCAGLKNLASFPLGSAIVREFGGLKVGRCGAGEVRVTSDIAFLRRPSAAHREAVLELERPGDDLFPLGAAHEGHMEVFVDARGRLLVDSCPDGGLFVVGRSFAEGLERLLLGRAFLEEVTNDRGQGSASRPDACP